MRKSIRHGILIWLALAAVSGVRAKPNEPVPAIMDSTFTDSARYVVRIARVIVPTVNILDTIDITIESYGQPYAACQFKFGTNSHAIDIIGVLKGEIVDSCKWEYFHADRVKSRPGGPVTIWSVMALAKFSPDSIRPVCLGLDRQASIARLIIVSAPNVPIADSNASIFFWWEECRDNTISDKSGNQLYVSSQVLNYFDSGIPRKEDEFPTQLGTPTQCINLRIDNHPLRKIEFHNGGVRFDASVSTHKDSTARPAKAD